jgi:hypothetical protein
MYCTFYNGPMDGWEHECVAARIGEEWNACVEIAYAEVANEPVPAHENSHNRLSFARYIMVAPGRMEYAGMIPRKQSS